MSAPTPIHNDDRILWLAVRRGLLLIVKAIEVKYGVGNKEDKAA